MLAQGCCHIICAFGDQRQDRLFYRQATARRNAELGRRAGGRFLAHDNAAAQLRAAIAQRFKHHVQRHHFSE